MPSTTSSSFSQALAFFDRDHAFLADLLHRLGDGLADRRRRRSREMVPTCAIALVSLQGLASFLQFFGDGA
jgi:hypothetical protein